MPGKPQRKVEFLIAGRMLESELLKQSQGLYIALNTHMWPKLRGRLPPDELRAHLAVVARELSELEWFPMIEAPSAFDRVPLREFEEIHDDETLRMIGKHLQLVMEARRDLARHTHPPW
jgi:hypothetical protein